MKDLLHPRHRGAITRFLGTPAAPRRILLAFDYDGVLAPLVKKPSGAWMRPSTRALLRRLVRLYPVAVVSGRSWRTCVRFLRGLDATVVGNHGFELGRPARVPAALARTIRGWRQRLERDLAGVDGVFFEDKKSTLSVHWGNASGPAAARAQRAVYKVANRLEGTRLLPGKRVLNVLPHDFPTKGDAVRALVARLRCDAAMVLGDDVTDEDAFAVGAPLVFGVHVGKGPTLAPWRLASQEDVDEFLELLIAARRRARRGGGPSRAEARRAASRGDGQREGSPA
jgi:trehalose 6-phosphate phosphatase